jgi:hypothetical protein
MNNRNTAFRALHDLGAAAWFGGALMGAVGVNGASAVVDNPKERIRVASAGWGRWTPVSTAAIGAHLIGGLGLLVANRHRVRAQQGVGVNTVVKLAVTGAALAATAYSGILGARVAAAGEVPADGGANPGPGTPGDVADAQDKLAQLQWVIPLLTGVIVVLGAAQGEDQRPSQVLRGRLRSALNSLTSTTSAHVNALIT